MFPRVIGLTGKKGSGKSTAADFLIQNFGYVRIKFAKPLKDMLRTLGLTDAHIEGSLKDVPCDLLGGKTPRFAMQTLGTEWGRETIHDKIWVNAWKREALKDTYGRVVVDDCRFLNEAEAIWTLGGIVVRVEHVEKPDVETPDAHASEEMDFSADTTLLNDFTPEGLKRAWSNLLDGYKEGLEALKRHC